MTTTSAFIPATTSPRWLSLALDQIDYGVLVLAAGARVLHANAAARQALGPGDSLELHGDVLRGRDATDNGHLLAALADAQRGLRRMVLLSSGGQTRALAVMPLATDTADGRPLTLLLLGKSQLSDALTLQGFARSHGLTHAETWVLESLCRGLEARDVATQRQVSLATVRTQILSIRTKTGVDSIRHLMLQVASLPPLLGLLRLSA